MGDASISVTTPTPQLQMVISTEVSQRNKLLLAPTAAQATLAAQFPLPGSGAAPLGKDKQVLRQHEAAACRKALRTACTSGKSADSPFHQATSQRSEEGGGSSVPTAGFTMVPSEHVGHGTALLCCRYTGCLLCALTILEVVGTLGLMIYALLVEAGNLVNLPNKRIGFYNFCLWNETARELQCLQPYHLQAMGISWLGMALARVCVYICPVISFFYPLFLANMRCVDKVKGWRVLLIILVIKMLLLSGGLGIFLLQTSPWINPSDFTGGFLALVGTLALILLQILTVIMYTIWANHTNSRQSPFTEEALPIKIWK
ncbi:transmembrane protein 140 [Numida meleagris]|uniref:transmembrane protein 140 n=1 Tax=Numida meleagris TaxID=8996 RepID=UPI000B3D841C|nr:transmembrane protein 140 [Numida meleagris]